MKQLSQIQDRNATNSETEDHGFDSYKLFDCSIKRKNLSARKGMHFFLLLSFPTFLHKWSVFYQAPQRGASLIACCEWKNRCLANCAAWGKTGSISSDWDKNWQKFKKSISTLQASHLRPSTRGRQEQRPEVRSHWGRSEPWGWQPQPRVNYNKKLVPKKKWIIT